MEANNALEGEIFTNGNYKRQVIFCIASVDITEEAVIPKPFRTTHLAFAVNPDNDMYMVRLVTRYNSGSLMQSAIRNVREILSGKSDNPERYAVFPAGFVMSLRARGLDIESYIRLVYEACIELDIPTSV